MINLKKYLPSLLGCEDIIAESISLDTLIAILKWSSHPYGSKWVHRQALHFLCEEFSQVMTSDVFYELSKDHLLTAIQSDYLQVIIYIALKFVVIHTCTKKPICTLLFSHWRRSVCPGVSSSDLYSKSLLALWLFMHTAAMTHHCEQAPLPTNCTKGVGWDSRQDQKHIPKVIFLAFINSRYTIIVFYFWWGIILKTIDSSLSNQVRIILDCWST